MRNKRKHILTLILFCSLVFSIRAQQQHPYLFFTPDRIATLKEQLKSDKEVKANYAQVEQVAREALKENNPYRKLEYLALAYQVTGEKRYADKIKESIRQTGGKETLEATERAGTSHLQNRNPSDAARLAITGNTFPCNQFHGAQLLGILYCHDRNRCHGRQQRNSRSCRMD